MKRCVVKLRGGQMSHKTFLSIIDEDRFMVGENHNVLSLYRYMNTQNTFEKLRLRSWINIHHGLGIEWNKTTKRLNFGEEVVE